MAPATVRTFLNLNALKASVSSTVAASTHQPSPVERLRDGVMSRRTFLSSAGIIGLPRRLSDSPLPHGVSLEQTGFGVVLRTSSGGEFAIAPAMFGADCKLDLTRVAGGLQIALRGGYFPGTAIPSDSHVSIDSRTGRLRLAMSFGGFDGSADLVGWLERSQPLTAPVTFPRQHLGTELVQVGLGGSAEMTFGSDWLISLRELHDAAFSCVSHPTRVVACTIRFADADDASLVYEPAVYRTLVDIEPTPVDWNKVGQAAFNTVALEPERSLRATIHLEVAGAPGSHAAARLMSNTDGSAPSLSVLPSNQSGFCIPVCSPLVGVVHRGADVETAFVGGLAARSEIVLGPSTLVIGKASSEPSVVIVERNGQRQFIDFNSSLLAASVALPDAVSVMTRQRDGAIIRVATAGDPEREPRCATCDFTGAEPELVIPDLVQTIVRPEDRLNLTVHLYNLELRAGLFKAPHLRRRDPADVAHIAFEFEGQHLAEQAFFEAADVSGSEPVGLPPVLTRLSYPTRLAFELPASIQELPFRLEALLNWTSFDPKTVETIRAAAEIKPPSEFQTAIEVPYRLFVSPDAPYGWKQSAVKVPEAPRIPLWHARLVGPDVGRLVQLRAVWSPDYPSEAGPGDTDVPFRTSLRPKDRRQIVSLTHEKERNPRPFEGRQLILSGLGATCDLEGNWPYDCATTDISLLRWLHQAQLSQDNRVITERRGFLYPTGHRCRLIVVTERKLTSVSTGGSAGEAVGAYLRQRLHITVKEPTVTYDSRSDAWRVPFQALTIDLTLTPPLDEPRTGQNNVLLGGAIPKSVGAGTWNTLAFWPTVSRIPFEFPIVGTDWEGGLCNFSAPLIYIEFDPTNIGGQIPPTDPYLARLNDVVQAYRDAPSRNTRSLPGCEVAVARSRRSGDTKAEVLRIKFDSVIDREPVCPVDEPQFRLVADRLEARLPALRGAIADSENVAWYVPSDASASPAELYLVAGASPDGQQKLVRAGFGGQTDKSGGIAAPSVTVVGVSRPYGPVGGAQSQAAAFGFDSAAVAASETFDPCEFFDSDATILGCIRLCDIVRAAPFGTAAVPAIVSEFLRLADGPSRLRRSLRWNTSQLKDWPDSGDPIFRTQQGSPESRQLVPNPDEPTTLFISGATSIDFGSGAVSGTMRATLQNFAAQLAFSGEGVVLKCRSFTFTVDAAGRTSFNVDIADVELIGTMMSFVRALQRYLGQLLGNSGIRIEINSAGVSIILPSFTLPQLSLGVFSLQNLVIQSSARLSFRSEPLLFIFLFSEPGKPFLLTIGVFGGGGSVALQTDGRRVVLFRASFAFGASVSLDLGIASGRASILGGLTYTSALTHTPEGLETTQISYDFWVHAHGSVTALGFITVSVDFHLSLTIYQGNPSYSEGVVDVTYSVKIGFFEKSFTLTFRRRFTGSGTQRMQIAARMAAGMKSIEQAHDANGIPRPLRVTDMMTPSAWREYYEAFA